jgi:hypothetical protein
MYLPKIVLGGDQLVVVIPSFGDAHDVCVDLSDNEAGESVTPGYQCEDSDTEARHSSIFRRKCLCRLTLRWHT